MTAETWIDDVDMRWQERVETPRSPKALTVLYDPGCALCRHCRHWMLGEVARVPLHFVECTGVEARARYGDIPWLGDELVVVGDGGEVWAGSAAFLVCLWALEEWREWSFRLSAPAFAPLAERFFLFVSSRRKSFSALFHSESECEGGTCKIGR
jgi:predicted DCC family thiol-disulfide oxidoreductase YuxK